MIEFPCRNCGEPMEAPSDQIGQWLECPNCHRTRLVPAESTQVADDSFRPLRWTVFVVAVVLTVIIIAAGKGKPSAWAAGSLVFALGLASVFWTLLAEVLAELRKVNLTLIKTHKKQDARGD